MCLIDETVFTKPIEEPVVCWKVFEASLDELFPVWRFDYGRYEKDQKLVAKGESKYIGFHVFLSPEDAINWSRRFNPSWYDSVVLKVIVNKIIAIGKDGTVDTNLQGREMKGWSVPSMRALEMIVPSNQDFTPKSETEEFVGAAT